MGTPELDEAAHYLIARAHELKRMAERDRPDLLVEVSSTCELNPPRFSLFAGSVRHCKIAVSQAMGNPLNRQHPSARASRCAACASYNDNRITVIPWGLERGTSAIQAATRVSAMSWSHSGVSVACFNMQAVHGRQIKTPAIGKQAHRLEYKSCQQVDVEEVSGALNLLFMGTPITNAYRNLTNIILRVSPKRALAQPAVLINAHFDSSFGSPGNTQQPVLV